MGFAVLIRQARNLQGYRKRVSISSNEQLGAMNKVVSFITKSNRLKHLLGGFLVGVGAMGWYCAEYTVVGIASALEFKDTQWGGKWDWIDWAFTVVGGNIGYWLKYLIFGV